MTLLSTTLEVAIGLVFVFFLMSHIASWIQELIAAGLQLRGKNLLNALQNMLEPPAAGKLDGIGILKNLAPGQLTQTMSEQLAQSPLSAVCKHPLVRSLAEPGKLPSYLAPREFGHALISILVTAGNEGSRLDTAMDALSAGIQKITNEPARLALETLIGEARTRETQVDRQIAAVRDNLERWFDSEMERATGWYKRTAQWSLLWIGMALAVVLNLDFVSMSRDLWTDTALRAALMDAATIQVEQGDEQQGQTAIDQLSNLELPLFWRFEYDDTDPSTPVDSRKVPQTAAEIGWRVVGLLCSGVLISLGSPFWFDLLGNFVNLRLSGERPERLQSVPNTSNAG